MEKALKTGDFSSNDSHNQPIFSKDRNQLLYDAVLQKLSSGIFVNRRGTLCTILTNGRDGFRELELVDQCKVIQNIVSAFSVKTQVVDLSLVGGSKMSGIMKISKRINALNEIALCNQSVTGLFESRLDLLNI